MKSPHLTMTYMEGPDGQPVPDYQALVLMAEDFGADPISLLRDLDHVQEMATEGIKTTRVDAKGNVTESTTPDLRIAVQCMGAKQSIYVNLQNHADAQTRRLKAQAMPTLAIVNLTREDTPNR
jgi:hypothetical protein